MDRNSILEVTLCKFQHFSDEPIIRLIFGLSQFFFFCFVLFFRTGMVDTEAHCIAVVLDFWEMLTQKVIN